VDQQFAFTGWAFPARRHNDSLHRGVDNLLSADRTCKRVIEELEFDRAHGKIVEKKAFAYHSPKLELASCAIPEED
jgi:hypothetical protein